MLPPLPHADLQRHDRALRAHARSAAAALVRALAPPAMVAHVGCGAGAWLAAALDAGAGEVLGFDAPEVRREALRIPHDRFRGTLRPGDLAGAQAVVAVGLAGRAAPTPALLDALDAAGGPLWFDHLDAAWTAALPRRGWTVGKRHDHAGLLPVARGADAAHRAHQALAAAAAAPPPPAPRADLVAVVVPCHDYACFLPDAIASVAAQSWRPLCCVIVDDGSSDHSAEVAAELQRRWQSELDLRLVQQPNRGVAQARNAGLRAAADAGLVMQLDADDCLEPDAVASLVAALGDADLAHCDAREFGAGDSVLRGAERVSARLLRRGNRLNYCALVRRQVLTATGGYRTTGFRGAFDDWDLWLAAARAGFRFRYLPRPLLRYRRHGRSMMERERRRLPLVGAEVVLNHADYFAAADVRQAEALLQGGGRSDRREGLPMRMRMAAGLLRQRRVRRALDLLLRG